MKDNIRVPRTDAIYNMHGYLTKVPVGAIIPFIERFSPEGGMVVDMFAGSGMTALAARMACRNAVVSDISKLGQHIGHGYLTTVSEDKFLASANAVVAASRREIGHLYKTKSQVDGREVESIRTIWTYVYACNSCGAELNYYKALEAAAWDTRQMCCSACSTTFTKKGSKVVKEAPVAVVVKEHRQVEQSLANIDHKNLALAEKLDFLSRIPSRDITPDREMYSRSALAKWNLTKTSSFYSQRNAGVLYDLWSKIEEVADEKLRKKLLFCFTAILPRASKRYQWSKKAPLNAANQHYYISPVFYEWNVYDLFLRKVEAAVKSDRLLNSNLTCDATEQQYLTASADNLAHLEDGSVDFVFTDPPFGSNIFYSDMNLFQEAWLPDVTDHTSEAVIRTTVDKEQKEKSKQRYKDLLKAAFSEAHRVLKSGGHLSVVFGNSKGDVWALAQEAFVEAGFVEKPADINILDKGQRSVKGLNSGKESVATLDLIVTLCKPRKPAKQKIEGRTAGHLVDDVVSNLQIDANTTASHVYLEILKLAIYENVSVADVDLQHVLSSLATRGYTPDPSTGYLLRK